MLVGEREGIDEAVEHSLDEVEAGYHGLEKPGGYLFIHCFASVFK